MSGTKPMPKYRDKKIKTDMVPHGVRISLRKQNDIF